ncbi:MAG: NADPH-dependent glutamate synthase [Sarcina sp.]
MKNLKRVEVREQNAKERAKNFKEVCQGYDLELAKKESMRCLNCKNPKCKQKCPVSINIPEFIQEIKNGEIKKAAQIIAKDSALPAVCGRVCPQESQCEGNCILGIKGESVAIGKLEKFVADYIRENNIKVDVKIDKNNKKIAVIGSGPAGLTCAGELVKLGYDVTIFEALHEAGGVLLYGIPEFRLPKKTVVKAEIENLKNLGVKIETNVIIGKTITMEELLKNEKFEAIFIGTGAGLPKFMGIKGENANGVFSANEFLTRSNLMKAYDESYDTPLIESKIMAVIGGGNVAMDAARTGIRIGSEVHIIYRRGEEELPARKEEITHAKEEGVIFDILTNPIEIVEDENGNVSGLKCVKMKLGEADESGRKKPVIIENSEFIINVDTVIMALGTSPNPIISDNVEGLDLNNRKCLIVNDEFGSTTRKGIFAGGDVVTGAATVILAMEAGKKAAKGIDEYIKKK